MGHASGRRRGPRGIPAGRAEGRPAGDRAHAPEHVDERVHVPGCGRPRLHAGLLGPVVRRRGRGWGSHQPVLHRPAHAQAVTDHGLAHLHRVPRAPLPLARHPADRGEPHRLPARVLRARPVHRRRQGSGARHRPLVSARLVHRPRHHHRLHLPGRVPGGRLHRFLPEPGDAGGGALGAGRVDRARGRPDRGPPRDRGPRPDAALGVGQGARLPGSVGSRAWCGAGVLDRLHGLAPRRDAAHGDAKPADGARGGRLRDAVEPALRPGALLRRDPGDRDPPASRRSRARRVPGRADAASRRGHRRS